MDIALEILLLVSIVAFIVFLADKYAFPFLDRYLEKEEDEKK